ncbi:hypothetical protein [Methyloglobulus sp.]|uniref:hypothetical protein n=1 Tax=Methyloglobulus sp. TaxID=2518622 RepID=UPI0032B87817
MRRENAQLYEIASSHCATMFYTPCWEQQDGWGATAGIKRSGRVKFFAACLGWDAQNKLPQNNDLPRKSLLA